MYKINNKNIFLVVIICLFCMLALAMSTVSAKDITENDIEFTTDSEDVNIIKEDLSNVTVSVTDNDLNVLYSTLDKLDANNNGGNVLIEESTIKNSILTFENNNEIIFKNSQFVNTEILINGATTLYLVNCSFDNSEVDASVINLLTIDLIINKSSIVNLTSDHIFARGFVYVNDHSNFHLNVTKTSYAHRSDYYEPDEYDSAYYLRAFSKIYELIGYNGRFEYSTQLIMVNGLSNATGHINDRDDDPFSKIYGFITFASIGSIDAINGAFELNDYNSNEGFDCWITYGTTFFKLPNGEIIEIVNQLYSYFNMDGGDYDMYIFYQNLDTGIYNYYSSYEQSYYFESINYNYENHLWINYALVQYLLFDMLLAYNETGFTNGHGNPLKNDYRNEYIVFIKYVDYNTQLIKVYINDIYNDTYEMIEINNGKDDYWQLSYYYDFEGFMKAYSGEIQNYYTYTQNIFLYQNIRYVDENGTVLDTEDNNIFFSLLAYFMENAAPYSGIKYYYGLYDDGIDALLMLLNVNMTDIDEVNYMREWISEMINEVNQIIEEIVIGEFGIDIWKTVVVASTSNNEPGTGEGTNTGNDNSNSNTGNENSNSGSNNNQGNNSVSNEKSTESNTKNTPVTKKNTNSKSPKKADLAILKVKKVKSSNKKATVYKVTIKNIGSLKSGKTSLAFWHIRNNKYKTKVKVSNVKALKAGQKVTLTVKYYADGSKHKFCHEHYFVVNPNKNIKESSYNNNMMLLKS